MHISRKVRVALSVTVLVTSLAVAVVLAEDDEEKELKERTVKLVDLPQTVKATILKESAGFTITELQEVTTPDGVYYEAEWTDSGFEVDVQVALDGKVVDRERSKDEDNERGEKDDEHGEEDDD